jgi:hypothetical protein
VVVAIAARTRRTTVGVPTRGTEFAGADLLDEADMLAGLASRPGVVSEVIALAGLVSDIDAVVGSGPPVVHLE